jgi:hypothetical protein
VQVGADFKRDLNLFTAFAVLYNGFTNFNSVVKQPDFTVYEEACLSGLGGRCGNEVYTLPIIADGQNIAYWEAVNVLFALRMWHTGSQEEQYLYTVITRPQRTYLTQPGAVIVRYKLSPEISGF